MEPAEFEERAYEGPLYNQLERGQRNIFAPGQVLEHDLGFDRGVFIAEHAVWETLGYEAPPAGMALGYYDWPLWWVPRAQSRRLPRYRINLFIQAKRSNFFRRRPRSLKSSNRLPPPIWGFPIAPRQQKRLLLLADRAKARAHVTYAAPVFHTASALYRHTKARTIIPNSTFPSATAIKDHEYWFYKVPGAVGMGNPEPEGIEEPGLLARLASLAASELSVSELPFEDLAATVISTAEAFDDTDATTAHFFDDLQTLDRLLEPFDIRTTTRAYSQVRLFTLRFDLSWLIVGRAT